MFAQSRRPPGGGALKPNCTDATQRWYDEVRDYVWSRTPYTDNKATGKKVGHFTQLLTRAARSPFSSSGS
ncbi:hypothetical protein GPECTOR_31g365 [Gonium pectorale]|uniref:SCP domain-containing protein n=1 Tax=Gonium pectorale TaxID=33097 RepID=A0A150GDS8_GONPE|nr:hypothetical protein GPECTOR_31g365 [Gonium pectorale]|eukprot:KXZ48001.1 hypothetical protein GPECTOR_31g365 [Gonium pectorale]